jgi:hypothetical protein
VLRSNSDEHGHHATALTGRFILFVSLCSIVLTFLHQQIVIASGVSRWQCPALNTVSAQTSTTNVRTIARTFFLPELESTSPRPRIVILHPWTPLIINSRINDLTRRRIPRRQLYQTGNTRIIARPPILRKPTLWIPPKSRPRALQIP